MEISLINKPQDILHFWHRIAVLKDQLNENIRRSATHGYSRSTYKIDVENKIFLERLDMELQHILHQYVEYFSGTDTNISLLRDAFQSKNRLQVVRTQKISLLAKVILPYISKSNKSRNDWQMLVENMTDFFDTLGAYKNNQKELLSSERSVSVQERVDTILKNSQTVFSPDISPKSILPEKNDRLLAEEIAQARERDDTLALNRLSQEMMQRLEENEFPPSADARKEFDFRSSTLMDHIADKDTPDVSLISPENPLLMDTLEW